MWCTRLDRDRRENGQMKTISKIAKTAKAPKAATASAEQELGNAQGITVNGGTEAIKTEAARQDQMKTDLAKVKAGDNKRKASVKAAKATRPARKAKAAKPTAGKIATAKVAGSTKKDQVLGMIGRAKGATLEEIMAATGWQKHTIRGFISLLGKAGTKVESTPNAAGAVRSIAKELQPVLKRESASCLSSFRGVHEGGQLTRAFVEHPTSLRIES